MSCALRPTFFQFTVVPGLMRIAGGRKLLSFTSMWTSGYSPVAVARRSTTSFNSAGCAFLPPPHEERSSSPRQTIATNRIRIAANRTRLVPQRT